MATTPACGDHSITVESPADGNAAAGSTAAGELQRTESSADDKVMWKKLKSLNGIVFYIELLEYSANAEGTVAFLWPTVVLLGGFCSLLIPMDFWFATVMVFLEGTRVFISKDASVNQWLFGSTRAFRWDHFCFSSMHGSGNIFAVMIGVNISLTPIDELVGSQIIAGIFKVAILAITCLLLTRMHRSLFAMAVLTLFMIASAVGSLYGSSHKFELKPPHSPKFTGKTFGLMVGGIGLMVGLMVGVLLIGKTMKWIVARYGNPKRVFWLKVMVASGLVCLPVLQAKIDPNKYRYLSMSIASLILVTVNWPETPTEEEQSNALLSGTWELLLKILDTIMPILFFWAVMFPLPGISLKVSFYMLLSVIAAVLVGNLQIPVAFLQILLSSLRLHSLLAGHPSHRDYHPLPDGASPNFVPSIVVFYVLELCQGSSNILGVILGLISFGYRRSLVRVLGFKEEWGAKAVNLYYHQACMTIKEKGLFPMEKSPLRSLYSFAIESLGCTSSEMQIVRLHVLDYYLQQGDSKSKRKFIAQIAEDAAGIVTKIAGTISHLIAEDESGGNDEDEDEDTVQQIRSSLSLSLKFVGRLAVTGGKIGTRFRHELSGNPILLHSLQCILDLKNCKKELWAPAIDVIKLLALHDEATAKEIGSTHAVIPKLMGLFLNTGYHPSVRKAAGEVVAYLTITSSDNCGTILDLEAGPAGRRDLIKNLISMLQDDEYISVAANLLHNLYANSGDMLINLDLDPDAKENLKSALRKVMQFIIGNETEQQPENSGNERINGLMYVALRVASHIGYVIPKEDFAHVLAENLAPNTNAAAENLVGKLVDTLKSNREPNREFPRLRRVLIEMVISIVEACPEYIQIFRNKEAEEALNMLIGTSSRLEKYKIFIEGEGMVPESTPMQEVVDKAKGLITV